MNPDDLTHSVVPRSEDNTNVGPQLIESPAKAGDDHRERGHIHRIFFNRPNRFNRRELRAGWRLLIFVVLWAALLTLFMTLARGFFRPPHGFGATRSLLMSEVFMLLSALIAAGILGRAEKRSFADYALPWRSVLGGNFWWGIVWGATALIGLLLIISYYHGFSFGPLANEGRRQIVFEGTVWAVGFFVVGFFEEFFFRGYALFTLTSGVGFWPAAGILSVIFGAVHIRNPGENWIGALAAALIGLFFCFTVRRTGDLWFAIGFHAMWDYSESFIFLVPDSGATITHHLFSSTLRGPAWLTGGSVGPEASVFVFVVIVNLFILFHLLNPKARFAVEKRA